MAEIPTQTQRSPGFAAPPVNDCFRELASLKHAPAIVGMLANLASKRLPFAFGTSATRAAAFHGKHQMNTDLAVSSHS